MITDIILIPIYVGSTVSLILFLYAIFLMTFNSTLWYYVDYYYDTAIVIAFYTLIYFILLLVISFLFGG